MRASSRSGLPEEFTIRIQNWCVLGPEIMTQRRAGGRPRIPFYLPVKRQTSMSMYQMTQSTRPTRVVRGRMILKSQEVHLSRSKILLKGEKNNYRLDW